MTNLIIDKCDETLKELYKFSEELLFLGSPIIDDSLNKFETQIGSQLPIDFKYILSRYNSFTLAGIEVLGLGEQFRGNSLDKVYYFEQEKAGNSMFKEYFPFSPNGRGDHYCLDLSRMNNCLCPVVFWQHDYPYSNKEEVEICYENFIKWIKEEMIGFALED